MTDSAIEPGEVAAIGDAVKELMGAVDRLRDDPIDPGPYRVRAIVAIEALEKARKRLANDMVKEMLETGVTSFEEGPWTVAVQAGRVTVNIIDHDAIPSPFLKSVPDTSMIRRYLDKNPTTNWAVLETGAPFIVIRTRRA